MDPLPYIYPKSPDPYIERLGGNKAQAALARLAHFNPIIDRINLLATLIDSVTTGITAFAGGGQTNAVQLTATYNEVTVVASAGDSVKLLAAEVGLKQIVKNDGANNLAVFPATGDTIDDGAANASITLAPGATVTFEAVTTTNWETSDKAISIGKTLFVDVTYGNNTTAKPYNPAYAYATIAAAVTAASSGDLIWVRPGLYPVSTNLLKDGVNFWCDKGVTLSNVGNMFNADTTAGGTTLTGPTYFLGHAVLTDNNSGGGGFIQIRTNPSAFINAEFDSITSANISNAMVIRDGTFNLLVKGDFIAVGRTFNFRDTGNLFAEVWGTAASTFSNNANGVIYSSGQSWNGKARIKAKTFSVPTPSASEGVIVLDTIVNGDLVVELDYYVDTSAVTFPFITLGAGTTTCQTSIKINGAINTGTRPLYNVADTDHKLFITTPVGICAGGACSAGLVALTGGQYTTTATFLNNGGVTSFVNVGIDGSVASVVPVTVSSGTVNAVGSTFVTDGVDAPIAQSGGGVVISQASRGSIAPTGTVTGEFHITSTNGDLWLIANGTGYNRVGLSGTRTLTDYAAPFWQIRAPQALAGSGAVTLTEYLTTLDTTLGGALTMADGTVIGQVKKIKMIVDGGDGTLTLTGFTSIVFNDVNDFVELQWSGTAWILLENSGTTITP